MNEENNFQLLENKVSCLLKKINPLLPDNKKEIKKILGLWNMDTSLKTIIDTFKIKISQIKFNSLDINDYSKVFLQIEKVDNEYKFLINNINVTPITNKKCVAAKSTKNQYLRTLTFFDLLDRKTLDNLESSTFSLTIKFIEFYYAKNVDEWWKLDKIISFIKFGINSSNYKFKTLVYSFLICLIYSLDKDKIIVSKIVYFLEIKFLKNKKDKDGKYVNDLPYYQKIDKAIHDTYKDLIDLTRNKLIEQIKLETSRKVGDFDDYSILEFFLNLIDDSGYYERKDETFNKDTLKMLLDEIDFDKKISNSRSKLRGNILTLRNKNNDLHYSDIEPLYGSDSKFIHDSIEQQEAAHIFSVKDLKKSKNYSKEDILMQLEDPNNGILMDYVYHDAYDRGWLSLKLDGHFDPQKEWIERYYVNDKPHDKYPIMKIRDDVYNLTMKEYIKKMQNSNQK